MALLAAKSYWYWVSWDVIAASLLRCFGNNIKDVADNWKGRLELKNFSSCGHVFCLLSDGAGQPRVLWRTMVENTSERLY